MKRYIHVAACLLAVNILSNRPIVSGSRFLDFLAFFISNNCGRWAKECHQFNEM